MFCRSSPIGGSDHLIDEDTASQRDRQDVPGPDGMARLHNLLPVEANRARFNQLHSSFAGPDDMGAPEPFVEPRRQLLPPDNLALSAPRTAKGESGSMGFSARGGL